jgi:hypothetical protein
MGWPASTAKGLIGLFVNIPQSATLVCPIEQTAYLVFRVLAENLTCCLRKRHFLALKPYGYRTSYGHGDVAVFYEAKRTACANTHFMDVKPSSIHGALTLSGSQQLGKRSLPSVHCPTVMGQLDKHRKGFFELGEP